ncbi:hypothetical protein Z043_104824 [Scleropages formosus]|uniref:Calponin-homology (CH) domain-containing protein n=1 Tax=Scleropages formosus TaxID=113540 RepID=A0A0N8K1U1_SCLFO|nr:hypothetical protein Z043_104824 [Scleropages formosus]
MGESWTRIHQLPWFLQLAGVRRWVRALGSSATGFVCASYHESRHMPWETAQHHVGDLYEDLRDGHNLISLLEVLSGETLPREKGRMRFHKLQNVQIALDFLKHRQVKLVNIRNDDIADGNPKLTLGLIWTIILHFQVSYSVSVEFSSHTLPLRFAPEQINQSIKPVKLNLIQTSRIQSILSGRSGLFPVVVGSKLTRSPSGPELHFIHT